jgi:hypothetical protein
MVAFITARAWWRDFLLLGFGLGIGGRLLLLLLLLLLLMLTWQENWSMSRLG